MYSIPSIEVSKIVEQAEVTEAVVVFTDHTNEIRAPFFVRWFTRNKYRHCFVMVPSEANGTIIINQSWNGLFAQAVGWDLSSCALACHLHGFIIRRVSNQKKLGYTPRGLISCVSVVKSVLGVTDWRVITPYQLDRYLLQHRMIEEGE